MKKKAIASLATSLFVAISLISAPIAIAETANKCLQFSGNNHAQAPGKLIPVDKDFTVEAEIEDIRAFYVYLKSSDGEKIIYPNNLLLQKGISIIKKPYQDKEFED